MGPGLTQPLPPPGFTPLVMSGSGRLGAERTATEVHSTLCALVTTQAAASSAWSEYESILLDAETQAFFAARLAQGDSGGDSSQLSKNKKQKRKLRDDDDEAEDEDEDAEVAVICEHCGGAVPEVSLRVACMDGTTLEVTVAQRGLVREVKRLVGKVRIKIACVSNVPRCLIVAPLCSFSCATWARA